MNEKIIQKEKNIRFFPILAITTPIQLTKIINKLPLKLRNYAIIIIYFKENI